MAISGGELDLTDTPAVVWPDLLGTLAAGGDLSLEQSESAFTAVLAGDATPAQIGALLLGIQFNGVTAEELTGVLRALKAACIPFTVADDVIDTCGTGGSPQRRAACFNVSTL